MKLLYNAAITVVCIAVVIVAVLLVGVRLVGIMPYTVLSGSMEPTYGVGSMIYVVKVDPAELKVGDPVTYKLGDGTVVTHRITEIIPEDMDPTGRCFRTKGDANDEEDGPVLAGVKVIGKPLFCIPALGYFANFIQNPPGRYVAIGFCTLIALSIFIPELIAYTLSQKKNTAESSPEHGENTQNQ